MNVKSLYVGDHKYLVEYIDNCIEYSEFVMIRNFTFMNEMVIDKDIYFIQKSVFDNYIEKFNDDDYSKNIGLVFPIPDTKNSGYSRAFYQFNPSISQSSLIDNNQMGNAVYQLYRYNEEEDKFYNADIKCSKLKIYHPTTKNNINGIVHVDNYMNGIHFHYVCNEYNNFINDSETEIRKDNQIFSEYIEVLIPDLFDLFGYRHDKMIENKINKHIYNIYYKEDMGFVVSSKNSEFMKTIIFEDPNYVDYLKDENDTHRFVQYAPINLMLQPYSIANEISYLDINNELTPDVQQVKVYYRNKILIENEQLSMPFSVKIFPYEKYDLSNDIYILDRNLSADVCTFTKLVRLELSASLSFDNGKVSIISKFVFPLFGFDNDKDKFYDLYKYLYGINPDDYIVDKYIPELQQIQKIDSIGDVTKESMKTWLKEKEYDVPTNDYDWINRFYEMRKESIIADYEEEFETSINFIGYEIEIASDKFFSNVLYKLHKTSNIEDVNKFAFNLNNIFSNWKEKPEILVARTKFIDRYTGVTLYSNPVPITDEWFVYLLHDYNNVRLNVLNKFNNEMKQIDKNKILEISNQVDDDITTLLDEQNIDNDLKEKLTKLHNNLLELKRQPVFVNFINDIHCIVKKESQNVMQKSNANNSKIIFRPMFYKINDLQLIKIRKGVTQNIGINLSDYMTKITTFKLNINGQEIIESGRNNVYVIFTFNPNRITDQAGYYDITNQDDEYISSGKWEIF